MTPAKLPEFGANGSGTVSQVDDTTLAMEARRGAAHADSRDRASESALWVSEDSRAVEPRRLKSREIPGGTHLPGRGINAAAAAEAATPSSGTPTGAFSSNGTEPRVVDGFCCGSIGGWKKISIADGRGYLHAGVLGDRVGAEIEG